MSCDTVNSVWHILRSSPRVIPDQHELLSIIRSEDPTLGNINCVLHYHCLMLTLGSCLSVIANTRIRDVIREYKSTPYTAITIRPGEIEHLCGGWLVDLVGDDKIV